MQPRTFYSANEKNFNTYQCTLPPQYYSQDYHPQILNSNDVINDCEKKYSNILAKYSNLLGFSPFNNIELTNFLDEFTDSFSNLFDAYLDDVHRWKLVNTSLCNNLCSSQLPDLSEYWITIMYKDTKPVIYACLASNIKLLQKMDLFLTDSTFSIRLNNGYNLLHCLIEGSSLNIEDSKACISFLLKKNITLLSEKDNSGLSPLDLCKKNLFILEQEKKFLKMHQNIITHHDALIRASNDEDSNLYFQKPNTLLNHEMISNKMWNNQRRIDDVTAIKDFLQNITDGIAWEEQQIQNRDMHFKNRIVNSLSKSGPSQF